MNNISRRGFLAGCVAAAGAGCVSSRGRREDRFAVFISDLHVRAGESYQKDRLVKVADKILAMDPLPQDVVCFGDIAYLCGLPEEYETSRAIFKRLENAGIRLSFGMGNHDRRSAFLAAWPEYRKRTILNDHIVTRVNLGAVDLLMLDGLQGTDNRERNDMGPVWGAMSKAHQEWLVEELKRLSKPTFLASHFTIGNTHVLGEMDLMGAPLSKAMLKSPMVPGYIFGHAHRWYQEWFHDGWGENARALRTCCLPSTGHWGDIGYAVFRARSGYAQLELFQDDYFFPAPVDPSNPRARAERPQAWDDIVAENRGRVTHWRW